MNEKDKHLDADLPQGGAPGKDALDYDEELSPDELLKRLLDKVELEERGKAEKDVQADPEIDHLLRKYLADEPSGEQAEPELKAPDYDGLFDEKTPEPAAAGERDIYAETPDFEQARASQTPETTKAPEAPAYPFEIDATAFNAARDAASAAKAEAAATPATPVAPVTPPAPPASARTMRFRVKSHTKDGVAVVPEQHTDKNEKQNAAEPRPSFSDSHLHDAKPEVETPPVVIPTVIPETPQEEQPIAPVQDAEISEMAPVSGIEDLSVSTPEEPETEMTVAEFAPLDPAQDAEISGETPAEDELTDGAAEEPASENIPDIPEEETTADDPEDDPAAALDEADLAEINGETAAPVEEPAENVDVTDGDTGEFELPGDFGEDLNGDGKFDETDINLMLALGLEDELVKTVGTDAVSRVSEQLERRGEKVKTAPASADARKTEYVNLAQTHEILDAYSKVYSGVVFKLIAAALLAVALFLYENISLFGVTLSGPFDVALYPLVYYMADLQLLILALAVVYKNFLHGLGQLFRFRPTPDSMITAAGLIAFVYTIVLCAIGATDAHLFSFPVALIAMLTAFYDFFNLRREVLSFNIISSKKPKYALNLKGEDETKAERKIFSEYIDETSTVARVDRVSFIDDFFDRTDAPTDYGSSVHVSLLLPFIAAVVLAVLSLFLQKTGAAGAMSCGVATFLFCLPATLLFTYSVPFYRAEKTAYREDGAIIGPETLDEFSSTAVLAFDDMELFRPYGVKVRSVRIFGEHRIDRVIYDTASVFGGLGGILGEVFRVDSGELGSSDNVEYREVVQNGISASVDGAPILIGTREYLETKEVPLPDDPEEQTDPDISVMYMAVRGEAAAKMYISYEMESDFEYIVEELNDAGICLGVNSTDPNINDEMLKRKMPQNRYPVKVICRQSKVKSGDVHASSGIVARGSAKSLLSSILLCDKVRHIFRTNLIVQIFSILIGAALSGLLLFSGNAGGVTSVFAGLYELLWFIPMFIITHLYI